MLRSLVGSEMCIRDRIVAPPDSMLQGVWPASKQMQGMPHHLYSDPAQSWHCLLYTSDAADDLLCVDLGGRRIIKKKKTHTQQPTHHNTTTKTTQ